MRIELQGVTVAHRDRTVLADVDLVCAAGTVTVIVGHSGAGLTTLLKTAAGLLPPTRGRVLHDGQVLDVLDERQARRHQTRTGFAFQDAALWANTNLRNNLALPLRAKFPDLGPAEEQRRIDSALNSCQVPVDLNLRPAMLSQGQQKVLSILRALIPGPEAVFLDEPLASLDRRWRAALRRAVGALRQDGVTVVVAGHEAELADLQADQLVVLADGRVLAAGPPDAVMDLDEPRVRALLHEEPHP